MTLTPAQLGLLRGIAFSVVMAIITFLGDASHLNGVVSPVIAAIIASLALSLEHYLEGNGGGAMFGAVTMVK